jgi:prolyl 4-hydroxylase
MLQIRVPGLDRPYLEGESVDVSAPLVFEIPAVMSPDECAEMIARIEQVGPTAAPITTARGFEMRPEIRNNRRAIIDDPALAQRLYDRVAAHLPQRLCNMRPIGANERFRCYRYDPSHRFAPHYDGAYRRSAHEQSLLTFMVYLNEGFGGGHTDFLDYGVSIAPRTGSALLFQHVTLHEGCVVTSGVKYALRSDIMYRR